MPKTKAEDGLSIRQRSFVVELLKSGNASEAYRVAYDYKGRHADGNANVLMQRPAVKAEIAKAAKALRGRAIAQAGEIQEQMTKILRNAKGERTRDRIRAADSLAKIQKLYSERREFTGKVQHEHEHSIKLPTREEALEGLKAELARNPALRAQLKELLSQYE